MVHGWVHSLGTQMVLRASSMGNSIALFSSGLEGLACEGM
jgi:hypothetical protein